jgi:hypothetical protein
MFRRYCPDCHVYRNVDGPHVVEWTVSQIEWKTANLEFIDPMEEMPVLINVVPKNWGFNPTYEEEGL